MPEGDYATRADTYDLTRGASPTVVRALARRLGEPEGRGLLDVAGGTGNYAQVFAARGFRVRVVDAQPAMLAHAARKLGPGACVAGDAQALPFTDASFDAAMIVSAVHLIDDPLAAFREAGRVVGEGPLAVMAFTRENLQPLFIHEYFEGVEPVESRHTQAELAALMEKAGFPRVEADRLIYTDTVDGSLAALHTDPHRLAGPAYLRNTSFWHRMDEETRRAGLAALARDLRSGVLGERVKESYRLATVHGHATLFAAWP